MDIIVAQLGNFSVKQMTWRLERTQASAVLVLVFIAILAAVCTLVAQGPIRFVAALQLDLFLPGYAWTLLSDPLPSPLLSLEHMAKSLGLSIILTTFVGIGVQYMPGGLGTSTIVSVLLAVTLIFALLSLLYIRHPRVSSEQPGYFTLRRHSSQFLTALALTSGVFLVAYLVVLFHRSRDNNTARTSLSVEWVHSQPSAGLSFALQLRNQETDPHWFRVVVYIDDKAKLRLNSPELGSNRLWSPVVRLGPVASKHEVKADLFMYPGDHLYRSVHFFT